MRLQYDKSIPLLEKVKILANKLEVYIIKDIFTLQNIAKESIKLKASIVWPKFPNNSQLKHLNFLTPIFNDFSLEQVRCQYSPI